jgi:peptidyl-prolyl cis-trans isomerase C
MSIHASRLLGAVAVLALSFGLAQAKTLAKVNGQEITDADIATATEDIGQGLPPQMQGAQRESYVLDYLIDGKIVANKAEAEKMAASPEFVKKLAYMREKLLMEEYLGQIAKTAATDQAIQAAYDEAKAKQKPEAEVRARHILVENEEDAKKALARVKGGEDFAKVAKEVSKDPGSEGGELGWFTKERMVPEFAEAAFKLDKGQYSEPVKSQFGWHVIQVEDKRTKEFPPLDKVRDQVKRYVIQKAQSDAIMKLRESAKIERFDAKPEEKKTEDKKPEDKKPAEAPKK